MFPGPNLGSFAVWHCVLSCWGHCYHRDGLYMVCNGVWVGEVCRVPSTLTSGPGDSLQSIILQPDEVTSPVSGFNVVADWCNLTLKQSVERVCLHIIISHTSGYINDLLKTLWVPAFTLSNS